MAVAGRPNAERQFRPDIEGLRAVAVGLVILSHAGVKVLEGGYVGVDVFFVISGFLITSLLFKEALTGHSVSLPAFYARRVRRILPAASLVLVVTVYASYQWLGFLRGDAIVADATWTALFAANLRFALQGTQYLNALAPPSPLQHYWSLAVEEQFYLVWPLLFSVVVVGRRSARRLRTDEGQRAAQRRLLLALAAIIAASFTWSVIQTSQDGQWAFFSPLTRAWELALGASLAVGARFMRHIPVRLGPLLSWGGLAGIVGSALLLNDNSPFPGYSAAFPVLGTALVIVGGTVRPSGGAGRVLGLAPFQWAGKLSYSLYLWHWPLLVIPAQATGDALGPARTIGLVALALGLAAATYFAVENPVRNSAWLKERLAPSLSLAPTLIVGGLTLAAVAQEAHRPAPVVAAAPASSALMAPLSTPSPVPTLRPTVAQVAAVPTSSVPSLECNREIPAALPTAAEPLPAIPLADVRCLVLAAPEIKTVPQDLVPPLEAAEGDIGQQGSLSCLVGDTKVRVEIPDCGVLGDDTGTQTVVLFGDSHAYQWIPAMDQIGRRLHWRVMVLSKSSCFPGYTTVYSTGRKVVNLECDQWRDLAIDRINTIKPDLLVLGSASWYGDAQGQRLRPEAWQAAVVKTLKMISIPDSRKVVLGPLPKPKIGIPPSQLVGPNCLAAHLTDLQACTASRDVALGDVQLQAQVAASAQAGARYVDLAPWFCTQAACPAVIGRMNVYAPNNHLSATYARYLSGALQGELAQVMGNSASLGTTRGI